jgi:SAM-dependent methyltransferase
MAGSILRSAARATVRRIRRDRRAVMKEYDQGNWAARREQRSWERAAGLEAFLTGSDTRRIAAKIDGIAVRVTCHEYYRYRLGALQRLVREQLSADGDLVELGCGFGYNLFSLALAFPQRRFLGLDISPNGIETGRAIASRFALADRVSFDFLDLTRRSEPNFEHLAGRSCFTFFCLEQLPDNVEGALKNIIAARPRRVLHVESSTELLSLRRPSDWANYAFVKSMDYQNRLFGLLRMLDRKGDLRLLHVGRAPFAPTLQNDGFVATWEPCGPRS